MKGRAAMARLLRDESGMAMGIAVIMVVLIGLMGAGLLTFVSRDLEAVVNVNQGQRALEAADAGVQAAKQQLINDAGLAKVRYDGGGDDVPWSYCYNVMLCTGVSPTPTGSSGVRVDLPNGDYAQVTILCIDQSVASYKVVSEGRAGNARRKVEAIIRQKPGISAAPVYFSRTNITLSGSAQIDGVSFFAVGDIDFPSNLDLGTTNDKYFGAWAETSGAGPYPNSVGSFPNTYNKTARPTRLVGVAAQGQITGAHSVNAMIGTRSFDSDSTPYRVVPDYNASSLLSTQKIAFPFEVPTPAEDKDEVQALRDRALALEKANPGTHYYVDSIPGNGVDDVGMPNDATFSDPRLVTSWPGGSASTFETVVVYEFETYHANNRVAYQAGPSSSSGTCPAQTNKGVWTIINGDAVYEGNRRFDGGIFIRAYDSSGNLLSNSGGLFNGAGNPCLFGYVNSSGSQVITGSLNGGTAPELSTLNSFSGATEVASWRELY